MTSVALDYETLTDIELARRIAQRDTLAVRTVTRRNNQRLYRTAWSVLKNRADAEEAVQEGYLRAFGAIGRFAGASSLSTWLTRIVLNEALGRRRAAQRAPSLQDALRGAHPEIAGKARQVGLFRLPQGGYCESPHKLNMSNTCSLPDLRRTHCH